MTFYSGISITRDILFKGILRNSLFYLALLNSDFLIESDLINDEHYVYPPTITPWLPKSVHTCNHIFSDVHYHQVTRFVMLVQSILLICAGMIEFDSSVVKVHHLP